MFNRFDLEDFRYNNVNMTAFRLVDADNEDVQKLLYEMETLSPLGAAILNRSQVILNNWYFSVINAVNLNTLAKNNMSLLLC